MKDKQPPFFRPFLSVVLILPLFFTQPFSCQGREKTGPSSTNRCYQNLAPGWTRGLRVQDVEWDLFVPTRSSETVCLKAMLVLPGWKFPRQDWILKSRLEMLASRDGYVMILPEMGATVYETEYFPETRMRWNSIPGGAFLRDRFVPELQKKYGLLRPEFSNYLLGLSTGGRGVVMVSLQNPGLFRAGAAFSGDFDQTKEPADNLMRNVYGDSVSHGNRWNRTDNPVQEILRTHGDVWTMPLFLAHGQNDPVVPALHSRWMYEVIRKTKGAQFPVVYREKPGAGHTYAFWDSMLDEAFHFLQDPRPE